ncbi:uncharacterized protein LOC111261426 isoform X2 [Varroa jacobsoni]|uniref:uncharacterized protein LOC111261426 isoform X2 n=1 Tax=Varroa jacobsoni TaxID=62625 RepID=UPI000BF69D6B|nr:uncharacterized protein LOC111261426 isoform X2 [Varroa jacobsoni]
MRSMLHYTAALVIVAEYLVHVGVLEAVVEDRFLPHFIGSDDTPTVASVFAWKPAAPLPAQLHLSNAPALLVDNETVAGLLQQILAGNLQSVESRGRPLAVPSGGKPVAVIFSSSVHVVDLGDLRPPITPASTTISPHTHPPHVPHNDSAHIHTHGTQFGSNHTHGTHFGLNHTSLLESIISPLMSLTHFGTSRESHPSQSPHPTSTVAGTPAWSVQQVLQPVQMQPVMMMMMPISQMQAMSAISSTSAHALAPVQTDSLSHLDKVLQGILTAKKQQLINSTLLTGHGSHSGHEAQVSGTGTYSSMATTSSSVQTPVNAFTSIPTSTFVTTMQPQEVKSMDNSTSRSKQV